MQKRRCRTSFIISGKHIGIAFQIMDDYLDVFGNVEQFGKKHAGDIYENKNCALSLCDGNMPMKQRKRTDFWYSKKLKCRQNLQRRENF